MKLYHASKIENRESILEKGLLTKSKSSGYGKPPIHKAIYLFAENNKTVLSDLLLTWEKFDIYELDSSDLDINFIIADEDSFLDNWVDSICYRGTIAYLKDISKDIIKFNRTVEFDPEFSYIY